MTNNSEHNTFRGLVVYDINLIRRVDDPYLSIYFQNIHQFRVHDIIEIVSGIKS